MSRYDLSDKSRLNLTRAALHLHSNSYFSVPAKTLTPAPAVAITSSAPVAETQSMQQAVEANLAESAARNYALARGYIDPADLSNKKAAEDPEIIQGRAIHEARTAAEAYNPLQGIARSLSFIEASLDVIEQKLDQALVKLGVSNQPDPPASKAPPVPNPSIAAQSPVIEPQFAEQ